MVFPHLPAFSHRDLPQAKAPGGRLATPSAASGGLCWELGYWESEEAFNDPGAEDGGELPTKDGDFLELL